jgi:hypothetical protein
MTGAREHGVDAATRLFYDDVRGTEPHRSFIAAVDATDPAAPLPPTRARLLVAPAAFHREYPRLGADGAVVRAEARALGIPTALIPTRSTGGVRENARIVRDALAAEEDGSVVLVSLSKGGTEVRRALEEGGAPVRKVRVWVNVCGLVRGTPLVDRVLAGPWWRRVPVRAFLARHRADMGMLRGLEHGPGGHAAAPPGVFVVNVVACPLSGHTAGALARRHRLLGALGPNDGSTLLRDAVVEGGVIYPVWGADHYFRTPGAPALIRRILLHLGARGHLPPLPTA